MPQAPLQSASFTLDTSGVAGFFGGDEAISAMVAVHFVQGRKWLGWYNSPGSYTIAKKFGQLAQSRFWDGLFPGISGDPDTLFGFNGQAGPEFTASHSGTKIKETGQVAYLLMKKCESVQATEIKGRETRRIYVTIVRLHHIPQPEMNPRQQRRWTSLFAAIPISSSLGACIVCGIFEDWYCFAMILLGIISSGLSCLAIGAGVLTFKHPFTTLHSPPGDGFLNGGNEIVVLLGQEGAVNSITQGQFSLQYPGEPELHTIGFASMLLTVQFLLQLLLVPQGTLFGQILFLGTFAVSWAYSCYLSSLEREHIQSVLLVREVMKLNNSNMFKRYLFSTRTAMVVFLLLVLQPSDRRSILNQLLPNSTNTWNIFKNKVLTKLDNRQELKFQTLDLEGVGMDEEQLLKDLFGDAEAAYIGYCHYLQVEISDTGVDELV
ncbi:hypothetical protein BDQ12DRAFT_610691 [Crucibulum laeve]|uniref:Uncharacterized protein n=1 Tax=Crucibulum laeve TaxID=68775 RepID=A0A5C3LV48_9AGAR|nr:hypothetical protein BDQ12DRAFT_610691 [Crucibulum laeve]